MPPRNQPPPSPPSPPSPARFSFATGGFDFPQASALPPPRPTPTSRIHQLSQFLGRRVRQELEQRAAAERDDTESPRRRQSARAVPRHAEREPGTTSSRRPSAVTGRPRATPSEQYLRRSHARLRDRRSVDMDSLPEMADENTSFLEPMHHGPRQPKRRKLDHDPSPVSEYHYHKYGREGQTVSGRLKMEIVSCDGGEYIDDFSNTERLYKVQNVLSNDKSVYCSQSSRCNLLLKHLPDTPFCLEKVVIRAPNRGFTAPVQEGLVFVTMSSDNILSSTAAYHLEYSPRSPALSPTLSEHDDDLLSLREAVEDPTLWMQSRQAALQDRIDRLRQRRGRLQTEMAERDRVRESHRSPSVEDDTAENCPYHVDDGGATAIGVSAPTPPPFTITTESAQEESDENDTLPSAAVMADRLRRESRWRQDSDDDDDDDDSDEDYGSRYPFPPLRRAHALDFSDGPNFSSIRSIHPLRRAAPLRAPSRIEPREDWPESEGLLAPHARFFIARHKNKITIKFHPAISGKYILLKLWSPTHDGNIDIESVQFYGYGGQRFFPATQPC